MASAIVLQAQAHSYSNLQLFTGDLSQDVDEYIETIEHIGSLTTEPDQVLNVLLTAKLSGKAERWYTNHRHSLTTWSQLRVAFRERFQQQTITHNIIRPGLGPLSPPTLTNIVSPSTDNFNEDFRPTIEIDQSEKNDLTINPIDNQSLLNQLPTPTSPHAKLIITTDSPKSTPIETHSPETESSHLTPPISRPPESESFEDLENKCIHDHEQGSYSAMLVNINDPALNIQRRCTDETDAWDKLKQQSEPVLKSHFVTTDVEDILNLLLPV
jgi:hypothetical protein